MKTLKKIMAFAVCLVMVLAMTVTAFADEGNNTTTSYTISVKSGDTHTYKVYQIFTGTYSNENSTEKLSDVKWGNACKETSKIGTAVSDTDLKAFTDVNTSSYSEKLSVIKQYINISGNDEGTVDADNPIGVPAGYYLIVDQTATTSTYVVEICGANIEIEPKTGVPSFEKKVKDTNDTDGIVSEWQDVADYDIGDEVPFKLTGTVAENYGDYKKYYFAFHDVEDAGLTFNPDSVKVYIGSTELGKSKYTLKYKTNTDDTNKTTDGCTFEVIFEDLKSITGVTAGTEISVTYNSTLNNKDAVIGNAGNVNTAKLEYSNNPNEDQSGSGKPSTDETPWDNVIVFTYKVVINKVKEDGKTPLEGAEFTLSKVLKDGSKKTITKVSGTAGSDFEFKGLDDGTYILTETSAPKGYNKLADPIEFKVNSNHKIEWTSTDKNGLITDFNGEQASGTITFTSDVAKGTLTAKVVNKAGSTLPSTGGIGTRIFYIIGGLLMAAAAVVLITKVRFNKNK